MSKQSPPAAAVRTLLDAQRHATLATHSDEHPGYPFASLMPYALDASGRPLILISALAQHTRNLQRDPRAALLVCDRAAAQQPLAGARVTALGTVEPVGATELPAARAAYLERHPEAEQYFGFADFRLHALVVVGCYWIGGFGAMQWLPWPGGDPAGGRGRGSAASAGS